MKKIISCIALTFLLYACKKTETVLQTVQESATTSPGKKGGSSLIVTTAPASSILPFTAVSGGSVSSSGGGINVTDKGICFSTSHNPTIANYKVSFGAGGPGNFTCVLSGLSPVTLYYARAYAVKSTGTTYGNQISFTTIASNCNTNYGTVTDIDGNVYNTITINSQVWMIENLRTTRYRDGTLIPKVTGGWFSQTTGAYCNYNNDESFVATYGRLYNWYAVGDPHNLAPAGWHIATGTEWTALINYFGGPTVAGSSLKEAGTAHWLSPNIAYNNCGWSGLPGGYRSGVYANIGMTGYWWSSSDYPGTQAAKYINLIQDAMVMGPLGLGNSSGWTDKRMGYSVRCIKD